MNTLIRNGRVLLDNEIKTDVDLLINDIGIIVAQDNLEAQADVVIDANQQLVLPGIVDLHGDAFERQMLPRPKVHFPTDMALLETDRQMMINGITTAFHGVTYSWETGLRGRDSAIKVIEHVEKLRDRLICDTRIHLRWETYNLEGENDLANWLINDRISLLAFNDHMQDIRNDIESNDHKLSTLYARSGLTALAYHDLFEKTDSRASEVPAAIARLAAIAYEKNIPCASHDDPDKATRHWFNDNHVSISEFPVNEDVAKLCRELKNPIILGAPNVVRGGSHCNRISASYAVCQELCDVLTSDYFYPSMLLAIFMLMEQHDLGIADVWPLISSNAADAALLFDRGVISNHKRADIIFIDDSNPKLPEVTKSFIGGKLVYSLNRS